MYQALTLLIELKYQLCWFCELFDGALRPFG